MYIIVFSHLNSVSTEIKTNLNNNIHPELLNVFSGIKIAKNDFLVQFLSESTYFKIETPSDVTYIGTCVTDLWFVCKNFRGTNVQFIRCIACGVAHCPLWYAAVLANSFWN